MGQYFKAVNLDKKEFIHPHKLGSGLKLWEIVAGDHVGRALVVLTAAHREVRGGGDIQTGGIVGRWAGDRIAIVGDYAEDSDLAPEFQASAIYKKCRTPEDADNVPAIELFTDISGQVAAVLESELDGKFVGDGWKDWQQNGDEPEPSRPDMVIALH